MLQFFRKIRHRLLAESKFGNYLLYAVGEIILVVIGILIALQLNNLNDVKKNKGYEKEYLARIQSDIDQDLAELEGHFKMDTLRLDAYTFLGRAMKADAVQVEPSTLFENLGPASEYSWFEGINTVFEDMKSSGKTSLITSDSLRNKIQNYYRLFEEVIKEETIHNEFIGICFGDILDHVDLTPLGELGLPKRWKTQGDEQSATTFYTTWITLDEDQENILSKNYAFIKATILKKQRVRLRLYKAGTELTAEIDAYLAQEE